MYVDPLLIPFGAFATAAVMGIGIPIARAYARRIDSDSRQPKIPGEVMSRLERMEQSLDAVAVEVERISEGQRFTTRLLSESSRGGDHRIAARSEPDSGQG
jgi:hypothetical protein